MALAYHGRELGIPATVVMPTLAPMAKVDKCRVSSTKCMNDAAYIHADLDYSTDSDDFFICYL
jgi:threonine dehydratase